MLKEHIHDLFTEGLGDIFFMKYYHFLDRKIKNKTIKSFLQSIHIIVYVIFLLGIGYLIFRLSFPL